MKCNYDDWETPVIKSVNEKMKQCLLVMKDGQHRGRADMLRSAGIKPNPKSSYGFSGFEKTDYYLYRQGLIELVRIEGELKIFRITAKGRALV